jgi:hypothetical protein
MITPTTSNLLSRTTAALGPEKKLSWRYCGINRDGGPIRQGKVCRLPLKDIAERVQNTLCRVGSPGKTSRQICVNTLRIRAEDAGCVITFVITSLFYGQCLEAIKFKRSDAPRRKILSAASSSFGRENTSIGLRAFYWLIMKRIV